MSRGGHLENLFFTSSPELKGQLIRTWVGSVGVTCRSKISKIVPIRNPKGQLTRNLAGNIGVTGRSKLPKIVPIQDGRHGGHLENLFFTSSELKSQLT